MSKTKNKINFSEVWSKMDDLSEVISELENQKDGDEDGGEYLISMDLIDEICHKISEDIQSEGHNVIEDYEIGCSSNQVEIDDITFDEQVIQEIVKSRLMEKLGGQKDSKTNKKKRKG